MLPHYTSSYVPLPTNISIKRINNDNNNYNIKIYTSDDVLFISSSIRAEFEKMFYKNYTHVANMPGPFRELLINSKNFGLILMDPRMIKHVADLCVETKD